MKKKLLVGLLVAILLVGLLSGCVEEEKNTAPQAMFTYTSTNNYVDTEIEFTDQSETDDALTYNWDFGDEVGSSTEKNPNYPYSEPGTYNVTLTVTDTADQSDSYTLAIEIILKDIVQTAIDAGFSTLVTALTGADLVETLQGDGLFTVFAPTNYAFASVNQTWLSALLDDITNLTKVLTYHVLSGTYMSLDLSNTTVETLEGTNITITVNTTGVYVNDVMVTTADIECKNGVIHIIGEVLLPETVTGPTD